MENKIYKTYRKEVDSIINENNVIGIFLVGSAKTIDLQSKSTNINDIDIFVMVEDGPNQERIIKEINGIEFDINYFSKNGVNKLIKDKEYFFLKEMSEAKVIYSKDENLKEILNLCKTEYNIGPKLLGEHEKAFIKTEILSKVERLKQKEKYEEYEYKFLMNLYLKDLIVAFFNINNQWVPKDKKMMGTLKIEDKKLFDLVKKVNENYLYEDLLDVYKYIFYNIDTIKNIKITY